MQGIYLGLGSNLGNREKNLKRCLAHLSKSPNLKIVKTSSIYETEPYGFAAQPNYFNMVMEIATPLLPLPLFELMQTIELKMRRRKAFHWGPRIIDIDILSYQDEIINLENLKIPHEQMHLRKFVLIPLSELAQVFIHPASKKNINQMLNECPDKLKVTKIKSSINFLD
jgi:2-amino-4-hydroxy-6-hydroxymethyldihydropteridine diphosphokinase